MLFHILSFKLLESIVISPKMRFDSIFTPTAKPLTHTLVHALWINSAPFAHSCFNDDIKSDVHSWKILRYKLHFCAINSL